jgi:hypothetical protein
MKSWISVAVAAATTTAIGIAVVFHHNEASLAEGAGLKPVSAGPAVAASVPAPLTGSLTPHVVHFRDLPVIQHSSGQPMVRPSKSERGSEADEKRERSPISEAEADARRAQALAQPVRTAHVQNLKEALRKSQHYQPSSPSSSSVLNLLSGFDGPDISQCCGLSAEVPPDPNMAAGLNHVVATVNSAIGIYDKSGQLLAGPVASDTFFNNGSCTGTFDPSAAYDETADRYIINYDAAPNDCIAVSQTGDPTGAWNVYAFAGATGSDFFDYPHVGIGDQAIYLGANIFGTTFKGRVWALNKTQMYAGVALTAPTPHDLADAGNPTGTPTPMHLHGAPSAPGTQFIIADSPTFGGNQYAVWRWTDPTGITAPTLVGYADVQTATGVAAQFPVDQPQLGTQVQLQGNDVRTLDAEWRNGHLWMTHQMSCNIGAGPLGCARWAEIDPSNAGVIQAGVVAMFGQSISFPSLAVDANDNMTLGFTVTGEGKRPSVYITGRAASDAPGTLRDAQMVKAGGSIYAAFDGSPGRWGDYTRLVADPDGQHFWYLGEYSKTGMSTPYVPNQFGNWGTYFQEMGFGPDDHLFADGFDPVPAAVELHAEVNGDDADSAPGLTLATGDPVTLRYVVINTGEQHLNNILVTDSVFGIVTCPGNQLDPGADMICEINAGAAVDGLQTYSANVTAVAADGTPVNDNNDANYFGFTVLVGTSCTSAGGVGCPEALQDAPNTFTYGTVTSSFNISGCNTLDDVNVGLSIDHTYVGDLLITLKSPNNTSITLVNSPIAGNDNCPGDNLRALLDDASPIANGNVDNQCGSGVPSIFGEFRPSQSLSAFNGATGNGTWTLTVNDVYPQDTGTLNDWSLQVTCH